MIDLITDGVTRKDLQRKGHRAVFNAMVSTAASAHQRGWSRADWEALVEGRNRKLGKQNRTGVDGEPVPPDTARRRLTKAWDAAADWIKSQEPPWSPDAARAHAHALADSWTTAALDAENDFTANERTLLIHVATLAAKRGSDRLTLPRGNRRDGPHGEPTGLVRDTGLGVTALRTAFSSLAARGALVLVEKGTKRSKGNPGRANVYRLAPLNQSRVWFSGAPTDLAVPPSSVPPGVSGAPSVSPESIEAYLRTPEGAAVARRILDGQES